MVALMAAPNIDGRRALLIAVITAIGCTVATVYSLHQVSQACLATPGHHGLSEPATAASALPPPVAPPPVVVPACPAPERVRHVAASCGDRHPNEPRGLYIGDGRLMCHAAPLGISMMLDAADKGLTVHICRGVGWEWDTSAFFKRVLRPGDHVLDVGTNVGYFTVLYAQTVGYSGKVLGIEAHPRTFDLVSTTLEFNGLLGQRVQVINHAVFSEDDKELKFSTMPGRPLNNHLVMDDVKLYDRPVEEVGAVTVRTITIDTAVKDWTRLDLVKIDVEGAERFAYQGMRQTLQKYPQLVVVMEVNTMRMGEDVAKPFYDQLAADWPEGICRLVEGRAVPTSVEELMANKSGDDMVVLTKRREVCRGSA